MRSFSVLVSGAWLALVAAQTLAQTPAQTSTPSSTAISPKAQYEIDRKLAVTRYKEDQKLCDDAPDSASRMQCKRDAKSEYDQSIKAAKTRMDAQGQASTRLQPTTAACADCGRVISVAQIEKEGEAGPLGTIGGGIAGALIGRQFGGGSGVDLATVAGAAGGAYAGRMVEKKVTAHKVWNVTVQYPDGGKSSYEFDHDPGFMVGDSVRKSDNTIVRHAP